MNVLQKKHFKMIGNVQIVLDENAAEWTNVPAIVQQKNNLDELVLRMDDWNEKSGISSKPVTSLKNRLRETLVNKVTTLAGKLYVLGVIKNDEKLKLIGSIGRSDLQKVAETEMEAMVNPILDAANTNIKELAEYGATKDQVTEISTSLDLFKAQIGQPRNIRNNAYIAINKIDDLMDEAMELLNKMMDKLMLMYRISNPEFYGKYERARVIVD